MSRWWMKRRTGGTWEDLRQCNDVTDDYFREKLRTNHRLLPAIPMWVGIDDVSMCRRCSAAARQLEAQIDRCIAIVVAQPLVQQSQIVQQAAAVPIPSARRLIVFAREVRLFPALGLYQEQTRHEVIACGRSRGATLASEHSSLSHVLTIGELSALLAAPLQALPPCDSVSISDFRR
ncbi:hypothetical protein CBR_g40893 [Chara braunii]|uniref:Uncharacterized protein n=1 Tax=Chara braunii TaxID=69332 RepID=A0A388K2K7_CHABU|nr:hypothetical protein CBR_g40893 [Chara braunii]|eukprot:GBG64193.1 hypothetical protein CBR_g40893 [Chara braunii]